MILDFLSHFATSEVVGYMDVLEPLYSGAVGDVSSGSGKD